jgi:hypothetical protein
MLEQHQVRADLARRYGRPKSVDTAGALRLLGKRAEVHPRCAFAAVYSSQEAAEAFRDANLEYWGHPSLGLTVVDGGVLGAIDLRPSLRGFGVEPTDPALPDGWRA